MRCARALPIFPLMPAVGSRSLLSPPRCWVDFPERLSGRTSSAARTPGTPSIIMLPDHCPWTQISSLVPFGDAAHAENRVRSLAEVDPAWRSEPVDKFDPGNRWWGCALLPRARGSDSISIPVRFLRATAFM